MSSPGTGVDLKSLGLRERKKIKNRNRLVIAAHRLFLREGYDAATLERICDEAEISITTFRRYFESKERLALDAWHNWVEECESALLGERTEDALTVWRDYLPDLWPRFVEFVSHGEEEERVEDALALWKLISTTPELAAERTALERQMGDILGEALSRDAGRDPETDLYSQIVAAGLMSTARLTFRHWAMHADSRPESWPEVSRAATDMVRRMFPSREQFADSIRSDDPPATRWLLKAFSGTGQASRG